MCINGTQVLPGSVRLCLGCINSHCKESPWIFYEPSGQKEWKTTKGLQQTHTVTRKSISRGSPPALSAALQSKADSYASPDCIRITGKDLLNTQCILNLLVRLKETLEHMKYEGLLYNILQHTYYCLSFLFYPVMISNQTLWHHPEEHGFTLESGSFQGVFLMKSQEVLPCHFFLLVCSLLI